VEFFACLFVCLFFFLVAVSTRAWESNYTLHTVCIKAVGYRGEGGRVFSKELHDSHVGRACNDCNGSTNLHISRTENFSLTYESGRAENSNPPDCYSDYTQLCPYYYSVCACPVMLHPSRKKEKCHYNYPASVTSLNF